MTPKDHRETEQSRDRGAGSNVLGRDYDACFTMTAHAQNNDAAVIDVLLRNYPPQDPFTVVWGCDDNGYCFGLADDVLPEKKTSRGKNSLPAMTTYLPIAEVSLTKMAGVWTFHLLRRCLKKKPGYQITGYGIS